MFIACGNEVVFLKRVSINNVSLDENLLPGQFRQLTLSELEIIKEGLWFIYMNMKWIEHYCHIY